MHAVMTTKPKSSEDHTSVSVMLAVCPCCSSRDTEHCQHSSSTVLHDLLVHVTYVPAKVKVRNEANVDSHQSCQAVRYENVLAYVWK